MSECWKLIENCDLHLDILEECKRFNDWKEYNASNAFNAGRAEGTAGRWIGKPTHKTFPTFMKWYEERTDLYHWKDLGMSIHWARHRARFGPFGPEIRKLDAGATILPHIHDHKLETKFLYNMSINHPEGCDFIIEPEGKVPYIAGDVFKINVHNEHSVYNKTNEDRYHAILGVKDGTSI